MGEGLAGAWRSPPSFSSSVCGELGGNPLKNPSEGPPRRLCRAFNINVTPQGACLPAGKKNWHREGGGWRNGNQFLPSPSPWVYIRRGGKTLRPVLRWPVPPPCRFSNGHIVFACTCCWQTCADFFFFFLRRRRAGYLLRDS